MLPQLAHRIDPHVWAARLARIETQLQDQAGARVRLRRCAEITADYHLEMMNK